MIRVFVYIHYMKKVFRSLGVILIVIVLAFEMYLIFSDTLFVNKVIYRTLLSGKTGPDLDELNKFPKHEVNNQTPQPWPISMRYNQQQLGEEVIKSIDLYKTVSFLVIKDDSLLFELNREGYGDTTYANSFSMAKSINSILIGCAIKDGLIQNVDEPVSNYIDEFKDGEKAVITIKQLLTMSSGIDFDETYFSPFAWPAEAYYGPDVNALTLRAKVKETPGNTWIYKGGDSQLLGIVLSRVLKNKSIAEYASEKLWKPIGAEHPAYWSTDEKGMEKVSCCFYTNAKDFARIAKLYMNKGNWNGVQIVDTNYVNESISAANILDKEGKPNDKYGYQWWLMKHKDHNIFYMRGIRGQYVFAIPDLNTIVVRLGHKRASKKGDELPSDIYIYLDAAMALGSKSI